jgi:hypothetical protein
MRVFSNYSRNTSGEEKKGAIVVASSKVRNSLAPESTHFSVRKNCLQAIADFDSIAAILDGEQNQNTAIGGYLANTPTFKQVYRVRLNVSTVK